MVNTADGSASTELLNTLDSGITSADIEQISVSSLTVQKAIGKLKRGKSDGGSLVSGHIIEAPIPICQFLARVFTSVLRHGLCRLLCVMPRSNQSLRVPRIHLYPLTIAGLLLHLPLVKF